MRKVLKTGASALAVLAMTMAGAAAGAAAAQSPDAAATSSQAPSAAEIATIAEAVLAESYPADGPGAAVVVMRGGKVIYTGARGMADLAGGTAITPDTVFRLGSITKQFAAAMIVQLAQEGKLSLDDPLAKFFPDYPQPGSAATVRQLLQHTSGIQSYTSMPGAMAPENIAKPRTTAELIAWFRDQPSPHKPGEAWEYNNSGYVLLGAIIEQVTGKPWHQALEERITGPLGLATIRYGVGGEDTPKMAEGYSGEATAAAEIASPIHMSIPHAAGALIGTVGDLAKWAQALHHGKVVDAGHYALMIAPGTTTDGKTHSYGFGLALDPLRGQPAIGHGGGINGFSTDSIYVPSADLFVAVFTNSDSPQTGPGVAMRRIAAAAIGDPYPAFTAQEADPADYEPFFGIYPVAEGGERRFFFKDGAFYAQRQGGGPMQVWPAGEGRFFYGSRTLSWFRLRRAEDGTPVMDFMPDGENEVQTGKRLGPIPPEAAAIDVPRAVLERYAGRYALGPATLTIAFGPGGGLIAELTGQPPVTLTPIGAGEFRVEEVDAILVFEGEEGPANAAVLKQAGQEMRANRVAE
ncbi:serine hydrolase domain-containing protein [Erythrobacter colymbi]|uniref:serine hydrolase domain-containing protein n=1 Tax=Erythrobacter colymbi TaxID=1161202 RepID=UPI000A3D2F68|nr:serine hydrolase domain-containing protein [Erythrobacter colymbi]